MLLSDVCLSVCLTSVAYIGPKSRTERPRKTKIGTDIAHVTRDSDTTFKIKRSEVNGQGHQAALLSAALTRKADAVVSVGTYSAWESTATMRLLGGARGAKAPTGGGGDGRGISCRHAHSFFRSQCSSPHIGQAYSRNVGRRMVVARSNCSRTGVELRSNRSQILVVTTASVLRCDNVR